MVLKLLSSFLFAITFIQSAQASQSFLDLGFIVPPGYFALGGENIQQSMEVSDVITTKIQVESTTTQGFLHFGIFSHVDLKIAAGQAKAEQTTTLTNILNGTSTTDTAKTSGSTDPNVTLGIRWIGTGDENTLNVLTHFGYSPKSGDKKYPTDDQEGNSLSGRSRYMGQLGLNLKFVNADWLVTGTYVMNNKGDAIDADDTTPRELAPYTTTTFELRYRLNFGRVFFIDLFGGQEATSEMKTTNLTSNATSTTAAMSGSFFGGGLGLLIAERFKLEGQIRAGNIGQKMKVTSSTGSTTELEIQKDQRIYLSGSFIF